jgi:Fe-S-cluster-containing hydrogenase component 2
MAPDLQKEVNRELRRLVNESVSAKMQGKGIAQKVAAASQALSEGKIKKAMLLTDTVKTQPEHKIVVDIAKKCVEDKEKCLDFCEEGAIIMKDRITPVNDEVGAEGLEEMLKEEEAREQVLPLSTEEPISESAALTKKEMSAEEAYESCMECHVANAAVLFAKIAEKDECDGKKVTEKLQPLLDDQLTPPEKWIKTMAEITEEATCDKLKYGEVLGELTDYLGKKDSPILKNLDMDVKENG